MPIMITDGQKSYLNELLGRADAKLTDYTLKMPEELDCTEAANIIADLKSELYRKRLHRFLYRKQQIY